MISVMVAALIQSPSMAKRKSLEDSPRPDDIVRFTALMRRDDRARFKYFCERTGQEMEQVGARWIMDRLTEEEKRLDRR